MNQLQVFKGGQFGELLVIVVEGVEWFGATEAATALSFSKPHDAIKNHVDEDDSAVHGVIDSLGRRQNKKFINESGLYSLILGAAKQGNNSEIKEKAKEFKRWITSDVLPTIRKHGMYATDELLDNPDFMIEVFQRLKAEKEERKRLEAEAHVNKPKVLFADAVATSPTSTPVGELAKILKQNGVETGEKRLFKWMRDNGCLIKRRGSGYNMPTQRAMEKGLFEIKETTITHFDGRITINKTSKVTGRGQVYFINKFKSQSAQGMAYVSNG